MPRLFTGIDLPDDIRRDLALMQGGLPGASWVEPESYHITLRFAGDIDDMAGRELALTLGRIRQTGFRLRLKGTGYFGSAKPHALYAGVAGDGSIERLNAAHERACRDTGLPAEARRFLPHVTLARLSHTPVGALQGWIGSHAFYESRVFEVEQFLLYSARPLRGGGPYVVESAYPLQPKG